MHQCKKCNEIFDSVSKLANHSRWYHKENKEFVCKKCYKAFKDNSSFVIHSKYCIGIKEKIDRTCPKCGYVIKTCYNKHLNYCDGSGPRRLIKRHPGGKLWLKGKTFEEGYGNDTAKIMKEKTSKKLKGNKNWEKVSDKVKEVNKIRARELILKRYSNGWLPKAGRCKKITYENPNTGLVKLDGSWELCVAIYLDNKSIKWLRNKKRFKYINLKGYESHYTPDFYICDWGKYLEVKGYETDLDSCKWSQFKDPLIIWKKSDINKIKEYIKNNKECLDIYFKFYNKLRF